VLNVDACVDTSGCTLPSREVGASDIAAIDGIPDDGTLNFLRVVAC
jgi:hypothetical protein